MKFRDEASRRYLLHYTAHRRRLCVIIPVAILQPIILVPVAFLIRRIFDSSVPAHQTALSVAYGAAMIALNLVSFVALLWIRHATLAVTKPVTAEIRSKLIAKLYLLPADFHNNGSHGGLHSLIVNDTERVDVMSNAIVAQVLPAAMAAFSLGAMLLCLSWRLATLVLVSVPILCIFHGATLAHLQKRVQAYRQAFEQFSTRVLFAIKCIRLTRMHAAEQEELERQDQNIQELRDSSNMLAVAEAWYSLGQSWLLTLNVALILVAGGLMVGHKSLSMGQLLSFYVTLGLLLNSVKSALFAVPQITMGAESLVRLETLLAMTDAEPYRGTRRLKMLGELRFEEVDFSYGRGSLLEQVNCTIKPQTVVAIAGPNGSGKTTLVHLICGLSRPNRGKIFIDGWDYETLSMPFLRQQIGVMMQDPLLFRGTVRENIAYGNGLLSGREILRAARIAGVESFISELPLGLDSRIGEDGLLLSGGQRQRIAIARALVRRPRLLILDEPTNHLDRSAVVELLLSIRDISPRPTILMISHDRQVLEWADEVIAVRKVVASPEMVTIPECRA